MIIIIVRKLVKKIKKHSFGKRMGFSLGIWKKKSIGVTCYIEVEGGLKCQSHTHRGFGLYAVTSVCSQMNLHQWFHQMLKIIYL